MIEFKAFAKVNLGLKILRKRDDGYHNIETIFHRINLYDEIIFEDASKIIFETNEKDLPQDENNLCVKAAKLLQQFTGLQKGAHISLMKNIPIGAGLGGGSSDAASTLIGLTKLWHVNVPQSELFKLAVQLGSDVPFFLGNGSAHAFGRGEILNYFDLDLPYWIVTVYPDVHISTAWAYQEYDNSQSAKHFQDSTSSLKQIILENIENPKNLNYLLHNDFEPIVLHKYQILGHLKLILYSEGALFAQLTGSGSSIYGLFQNESDVLKTADKLGKQYKVFITQPHFKPTII